MVNGNITGVEIESCLGDKKVYQEISTNEKVANYLRFLNVKHPAEWADGTYTDDFKDEYCTKFEVARNKPEDFITNMENNLTFWDDSKLPSPTGLWYFHPISFINHLKRAFTYNPYKDRTIKEQWIKDGRTLEEKVESEIKDSPGFGPHTEIDDIYGGYARITGLFKQEYYSTINAHVYPHAGVDFSGIDSHKNTNAPIHSFINGKVVGKGKFIGKFSFGKFLLVEDLVNTSEDGKGNKVNYYYLLAHLSDYAVGIDMNTIIEPGDTVAYVGNTGTEYAHLHLSFLKAEKLSDIYNSETNITVGTHPYTYNPFRHDEKFN